MPAGRSRKTSALVLLEGGETAGSAAGHAWPWTQKVREASFAWAKAHAMRSRTLVRQRPQPSRRLSQEPLVPSHGMSDRVGLDRLGGVWPGSAGCRPQCRL